MNKNCLDGESSNMKKKEISSVAFYLVSAVFYVVSIITFAGGNGNSTGAVWLCLGSTFLCLGTAMARKSGEKPDDKENTDK